MPKCCNDSKNQVIIKQHKYAHEWICFECGRQRIQMYDPEKMKMLGMLKEEPESIFRKHHYHYSQDDHEKRVLRKV